MAAVSNNQATDAEKKDIAKEVFNTHYSGSMPLALVVTPSDGRVEMSAEGKLPTSISSAVGVNDIRIKEISIAEMNRENTICVLALSKKGKGQVRFLGETEFDSPSCSVQSNSQHVNGIVSTSSFKPIAKTFCSAGGASGQFTPAVRGECATIEDPYTNRNTPAPGACMPDSLFNSVPSNLFAINANGLDLPRNTNHTHPPGFIHWHTHQHCHGADACHSHEHTWHRDHHDTLNNINRLLQLGVNRQEYQRLLNDYDGRLLSVRESNNYTGPNKVLYPGTYCGGLTVDGSNVRFAPGTYIIKDGPLTFKNGAVATAMDVSFVFTGPESVLTIETGSYVTVKAPKRGPLAGLAFVESGKSSKNNLDAGLIPSGVNLLSSGGDLNVTGTLYFPTQALEVVGDSVLGAKAPATSFIAYQVTFAGETKASVSVDHIKGGIPPMLPRSDDGARLVK